MKNNVRTINDYIVRENKKKYNTERISFLSHISHGILTPLNSIMGFSKLMDLKELINEKRKEYIQGILNGSNLLLQFVNNIMDLSQFEANNYSLRIRKYNINQILWDFTEDFYNRKIENNDTNINLMLVWDTKVKDLEIETDSFQLKKALKRIVTLVSVKYSMEEFELGYRITENKSLNIYIRPVREKLSADDLLNEHELYSIDEDNSFDYLNYKALSSSVSRLGGELTLNSENQEFSFVIPIKYERNKGFKII
jgi:signal transduction histidine kinase